MNGGVRARVSHSLIFTMQASDYLFSSCCPSVPPKNQLRPPPSATPAVAAVSGSGERPVTATAMAERSPVGGSKRQRADPVKSSSRLRIAATLSSGSGSRERGQAMARRATAAEPTINDDNPRDPTASCSMKCPSELSSVTKDATLLCGLRCTTRGLLRHVHREPWLMYHRYFVQEEYLLEQCQMQML